VNSRGIFVTGTDTGVGKTLAACALLHAFAARSMRVVGMKPVAAGAEDRDGVLINDDVEQLVAASNVKAPRADVNPYCFAPPIAPHIAANLLQSSIQMNRLCDSYQRLTTLAEVVVVEGAGGFCVPFNDLETSADFAQRLALPVVLVVGLRLGCINHALLTAEAIRARGLRLAGWIANDIEPAMAHADANLTAIGMRLAAPLLGRVAFCISPDASTAALQFDLSALL
jgi:dethiobiotin synthetase